MEDDVDEIKDQHTEHKDLFHEGTDEELTEAMLTRDVVEEQAARVGILMRDARQLMIHLTEGDDADALQAALDEVNRLRAASPMRITQAERGLQRCGAEQDRVPHSDHTPFPHIDQN